MLLTSEYAQYQNMNYDDVIPYFGPPLETKPGSNMELHPEEVFDTSEWLVPDDQGKHITKAAIDGWPDERSLPVSKRNSSAATGSKAKSGVVIFSTSRYHSATEFCNSANSWGDDFLSSTENLFCDMDVKKLWPVFSAVKRVPALIPRSAR